MVSFAGSQPKTDNNRLYVRSADVRELLAYAGDCLIFKPCVVHDSDSTLTTLE